MPNNRTNVIGEMLYSKVTALKLQHVYMLISWYLIVFWFCSGPLWRVWLPLKLSVSFLLTGNPLWMKRFIGMKRVRIKHYRVSSSSAISCYCSLLILMFSTYPIIAQCWAVYYLLSVYYFIKFSQQPCKICFLPISHRR